MSPRPSLPHRVVVWERGITMDAAQAPIGKARNCHHLNFDLPLLPPRVNECPRASAPSLRCCASVGNRPRCLLPRVRRGRAFQESPSIHQAQALQGRRSAEPGTPAPGQGCCCCQPPVGLRAHLLGWPFHRREGWGGLPIWGEWRARGTRTGRARGPLCRLTPGGTPSASPGQVLYLLGAMLLSMALQLDRHGLWNLLGPSLFAVGVMAVAWVRAPDLPPLLSPGLSCPVWLWCFQMESPLGTQQGPRTPSVNQSAPQEAAWLRGSSPLLALQKRGVSLGRPSLPPSKPGCSRLLPQTWGGGRRT